MLNRLEKLAPYLALLLGYLTYSTTAERAVGAAEGRKTPVIGKKLLDAELTSPHPGASPVGRDPFEVAWASYLGRAKPAPTTRPTSGPTSHPATQPATAPASRPAVKAPPLPKRLTAVFLAAGLQMAIIDDDDMVYRPGALIDGTDPNACWRVECIERSRVTLAFGTERCVLAISEDTSPARPAPWMMEATRCSTAGCSGS